jgi:hypothetical protein
MRPVPARAARLGRAALVAAIASAAASRASAQEPWRQSYFPYFTGSPTDGAMVIARYQFTKAAPYFISQSDDRDVINPLSYAAALSGEAGIGTRGSRFVSVVLRAPGLVSGWRFHGTLEGRRDGRFGFYGLGPADLAPADPSLDVGTFNRARRDRYVARAEATRNIVGPLGIAVAGSLERTRFSEISAPSLVGAAPITNTDGILRATLVVDTRDAEFVPGNGVLLEAGVLAGTDGIDTGVQDDAPRAMYQGAYLNLRGYVSPREGTVVAGRFALRGLSGGAPVSARYMMHGWERDITVMGGVESHRGYIKGRFGGRGVLLGGVELRHDLLNAGDFGAVSLLGFVDGGRVFDGGEGVKLTSKEWEMAYGGGVALRILRSAVLTFNFAAGGDGFTFSTGTGWTF